jgi:hypothetical protein
MISRLRKPISKSITTVLCPNKARPEEIAAEEVVLPTPPLPDVITIILAKAEPFLYVRFNTIFSQQCTRDPIYNSSYLRFNCKKLYF